MYVYIYICMYTCRYIYINTVEPDWPASRNIWWRAGIKGRTWRLSPVTSCARPSTTSFSCALSLLLLVFIPSALA